MEIMKIYLGRIYNRSTIQDGIRIARRSLREGRVDDTRRVLRSLHVELVTAITVLEACAEIEKQGKLLEDDIYTAHTQLNEVLALANEEQDVRRKKCRRSKRRCTMCPLP